MEWVVVTRKEGGREVVGKQEEVRCGVVSDSFFFHFTCRPPNLPTYLEELFLIRYFYVHRGSRESS